MRSAGREFSPAVVTDEARRRSELYLHAPTAGRRRRARSAGRRDEFLRYCQTGSPSARPARPTCPDCMSYRSARTSSTRPGRACTEAEFARLIGSPGTWTSSPCGCADRFGDDGIVGGCVTEHGDERWTVRLLMMSCRAMGRGVIDALLAWLLPVAQPAGRGQVTCRACSTPRNVPLRIALTGGRLPGARTDEPAGRPAVFAGRSAGPLPRCRTGSPGWPVPGEPTSNEAGGARDPRAPADPGRRHRRRQCRCTRRPTRRCSATASGWTRWAAPLLLTEISRRYGVDVAAEDLNLDAWPRSSALAEFISARSSRHG